MIFLWNGGISLAAVVAVVEPRKRKRTRDLLLEEEEEWWNLPLDYQPLEKVMVAKCSTVWAGSCYLRKSQALLASHSCLRTALRLDPIC